MLEIEQNAPEQVLLSPSTDLPEKACAAGEGCPRGHVIIVTTDGICEHCAMRESNQ